MTQKLHYVLAVTGMDGLEFLPQYLWNALAHWTQTEIAPYAGEVSLEGFTFSTEPLFPGDVPPSLEEQKASRTAVLKMRFCYYFAFTKEITDEDLAAIGHALCTQECPDGVVKCATPRVRM